MTKADIKKRLQQLAASKLELVKHFDAETRRLMDEDCGGIDRAFTPAIVKAALEEGNFAQALHYLETEDE